MAYTKAAFSFISDWCTAKTGVLQKYGKVSNLTD